MCVCDLSAVFLLFKNFEQQKVFALLQQVNISAAALSRAELLVVTEGFLTTQPCNLVVLGVITLCLFIVIVSPVV